MKTALTAALSELAKVSERLLFMALSTGAIELAKGIKRPSRRD